VFSEPIVDHNAMESLIIDLAKQGGLSAVILLFGIWLALYLRGHDKAEIDKNTSATAELTKELHKAVLAIVKLELQIEQIAKMAGRLDRTEKGLTIVFEKLKELRKNV